jgi:tRNA modification GTPase
MTRSPDPPARMPSISLLRATSNAPGAIGLIQVVGDIEPLLDQLRGRMGWPLGQVRRVSFADIDDGLAIRVRDDVALLMPHGGPRVMQRLHAELCRLGCSAKILDHPDPEALYPEAADPVEALMLIALARARSPLAIDLLLDQPRRWRDRPHFTKADEERSLRLNRLIHPPSVVVAGPPNVGKSTLSNALIGRSMSIALDRPGTTRDYTTGFVDLGGLVVRWHDTPGWHRADDPVEQRAITLAQTLMADADLLVAMTDAAHDWPSLPRLPDLRLASKRDLGARPDANLAMSVHQPEDLATLVRTVRDRLVPADDLAHPGPWRFDPRLAPPLQPPDPLP